MKAKDKIKISYNLHVQFSIKTSVHISLSRVSDFKDGGTRR